MEGMGLEGVAQPFQTLAIGGDGDARDQLDRAGVGVVAGQIFRIEQGHRPGGCDRNGLADADDAAIAVGDVGLVLDGAGIGGFGRGRDGRLGTGQGQGGITRLGQDGGSGRLGQDGQGNRGQQQGEGGNGQTDTRHRTEHLENTGKRSASSGGRGASSINSRPCQNPRRRRGAGWEGTERGPSSGTGIPPVRAALRVFDVSLRSVTVGSRKRTGLQALPPGPCGAFPARLGRTRFASCRSSGPATGEGLPDPPDLRVSRRILPARPFPAAASGLVPRGASPATGMTRI